jgi:glycosyltransferase involved in cell wall biosynthesis
VNVPGAVHPSDIAVVVPVGGRAPSWERSAESLRRLDPPPGEIVVVLDGPDEALAARAASLGATLVVLEERGGPARARNRGARATTSAVLLFVDADIEVPSDLVARVAAVFSGQPGTAAAFGSYDDAPGDDGLVSQYRNLLHHFVHQHASERASTFWAGCGAIRRDAFEASGAFDERYTYPSIEDIELGARLVRGGHSVRLVKTLAVKHLKRWRLADVLSTDLWRRAVPWTELMLREGRLVNDLNTRVRDRVSVVLAFVPLLALPAAWAWPWLLAIVPAAAGAIVAVNAALFRLFLRRRGPGFAAATVPLYWLYLLVCGAGFAIGLLRHYLGARA